MGIASSLDSLIALFSPERALKRSLARKAIERSEKYAAAKSNRLTGSWSPSNSTVNDVIGASSSVVRARVRQLVRDFPYFSRAINSVVDYTVGSGIRYQARVKGPNGKIDKLYCQKIEDALASWMDRADVSGRLHFYELQRLSKRQDVESGEFLFLQDWSKGSYSIQSIECDRITSYHDSNGSASNNSRYISQGVEYDPLTGRPLKYYIDASTGYSTKILEIEANRLIHGFETLRPGQLRGISPLVSAVLCAQNLSEYMESTMDNAKMASKWLAFVTSSDPLTMQRGFGSDESTGQKIEEIENSIIEYLRPGEQVNFASSPMPGNNFLPTVRLILSMLAVVPGVPLEIVSGDYQGLSFAVGKIIRADFKQTLKPIIARHIRQFCEPVKNAALDYLVLSGTLNLPGYWTNPWKYRAGEWQPVGMDSIDELRDAKSMSDQVSRLLRSPQEIVAARGRDLEEIYDEIAAAKEMAKDKNISEQETSTALANNPAALGAAEQPAI